MEIPKMLKPEIAFLVAFFATFPIYSPNLTFFADGFLAQDLMAAFVPLFLWSAFFLSAIVVVLASKGKGKVFLSRSFVIVYAICYIGGYGILVAQVFMSEFAFGLCLFAALLLAFGTVGTSIAWGCVFSVSHVRHFVYQIAIAVGLASLLQLLISVLLPLAGLIVFALLILLTSIPLGFFDIGISLQEGDHSLDNAERRKNLSDHDEKDMPLFESAQDGNTGQIVRMTSVIAVPLIGLLMFGFMTALRKFIVFDFFYMEVIGSIFGALMALIICKQKTGKPLVSYFFYYVLPLFALVLIILNAFPASSVPLFIAATLSYVFYGLVAILALACICAMAHAREFHPVHVYSLVIFGYALVSILGSYCANNVAIFQDQDGGPTLLAISTIYFAFLLSVAVINGWRQHESEASSSEKGQDSIKAHCLLIAENGHLSPRESEILLYLGRGYSVAFVAKMLVLSESTVRTHAKSIYRKLGVSSREELIDLIDNCDHS